MHDTLDSDNDLPERLDAYRLQQEMTYEQMAALTGIHASTIWKIVTRQVTPHALTVAILKRRLPGLFQKETVQ